MGNNQLIKPNIDAVKELEEKARENRTKSQKIADLIAQYSGTVAFAWVNLFWFSGWIIFNWITPKELHFDPYPFQFLTFMVSLEAIFLSVFILISENRQATIDEKRNQLDLQINLLAEQENSKILYVLLEVARKLDVDLKDADFINLLISEVSPKNITNLIEEELDVE